MMIIWTSLPHIESFDRSKNYILSHITSETPLWSSWPIRTHKASKHIESEKLYTITPDTYTNDCNRAPMFGEAATIRSRDCWTHQFMRKSACNQEIPNESMYPRIVQASKLSIAFLKAKEDTTVNMMKRASPLKLTSGGENDASEMLACGRPSCPAQKHFTFRAYLWWKHTQCARATAIGNTTMTTSIMNTISNRSKWVVQFRIWFQTGTGPLHPVSTHNPLLKSQHCLLHLSIWVQIVSWHILYVKYAVWCLLSSPVLRFAIGPIVMGSRWKPGNFGVIFGLISQQLNEYGSNRNSENGRWNRA